MSSTPDFARLQDRISSFKDCNVPFKNKDLDVFSLAIAGFHFQSNSEDYAQTRGLCHVCNQYIFCMQNVNYDTIAIACSTHHGHCTFYQKYNAASLASQVADVRVGQVGKYE
jgi:hypothetical protein